MEDELKPLYEDWQQELYYIESYTEYLRDVEAQELAKEESNEQSTCNR